jgi:hypothetical protein
MSVELNRRRVVAASVTVVTGPIVAAGARLLPHPR